MSQRFDLSALQSTRIGAPVLHALVQPRPGDDIDRRVSLGEILRVELLGEYGCVRLNRSQFIRLSRELVESFPDLRGIQVQLLTSLCQVANFAEELFWGCSANQRLRTKIISTMHPDRLFRVGEIETQSSIERFSSIEIRSNFVPCHPDWRNVESGREVVRRRDCFPSSADCFPSRVLEDVPSENVSLVERLKELEVRSEEFAVVNIQAHYGGGNGESKPIWEIEPGDFEIVNSTIAPNDSVWEITWRGGIFIMKNFGHPEADDENASEKRPVNPLFEQELEVVRRLSHPHVVYSFGRSEEEKHKGLWMEKMDMDLFGLIAERGRLTECKEPPFSQLHALDILLQIAKAMTYMHELPEPVIHGDLKPQNIFVLAHDDVEDEILGDFCQYYVKVADFGSARILKQDSNSTFEPHRGTPSYEAPEVLKAFSPKHLKINFPKRTDVYSFGIIAFQVLTGLEPYEGVSFNQKFREGVMDGSLRPPLQEICRSPNFVYDRDLVELVERCWHNDPPARPEFVDVTTELKRIYKNLNQNLMNGAPALAMPQANAVNAGAQVSEVPRRKRLSIFRKLLRCACISSSAVKE